MKVEIKRLHEDDVTGEFVSRIVAFSIAEYGAMGCPGNIVIVTDRSEVFETNSMWDNNDDTFDKLYYRFYPIHSGMTVSPFSENEDKMPHGWLHTYLGMGNHLFMKDYINTLFYKKVSRELPPHELYGIWLETVLAIINTKLGAHYVL